MTKSVTIGANGSYSVDVTGMTAPFVFRAEGRANGNTYVVHSAAAAADVNGNINITQLTELVVDNIAGQLASQYFDSGNFSSLSKTALDAEAEKLKEKLLPVLQALGVDASIDLLRTQFTPLSSALDSALDVLRVSVDSTTNVATITNIITQQQIQDDLAVAAAAEASPPQLTDTTGISEGADDITLVKRAFADFAALFASDLPPAAVIEAALPDTFLLEDMDAATFAAELASDPNVVGVKFTDVDIKRIDYTDPANVYALVDVTAKDKNGIEMERLRDFIVSKDLDGVWRLAGDRRVFETRAIPHMIRSSGNFNCSLTGIEFEIEDVDSSNNGGTIDHIVIYGPGLPGQGLRYQPTIGGRWRIQNSSTPYYVMGNSCSDTQAVSDSVIAAIPDNASYLAVAYSSADNSTRVDFPSGAINNPGIFAHGAYRLSIDKRPLTLAEAVASVAFPVITAPDSVALSAYSGGTLSVTATVSPDSYVDVYFSMYTAGGNNQETDAYIAPGSEGLLSTSLSLLEPAVDDPITLRSLRVAIQDAYRRSMMSLYDVSSAP